VAQRDSKSIARRWNREIEDEIRRLAEARADRGPWRTAVWTVLWIVWICLLAAAFVHLKSFG